MKKLKFMICCMAALFVLSALCGTARAGENMLANPNFELDANGELNQEVRGFGDVLEWNQWGDAALAVSDHFEAALHAEPGTASIWTNIISGPIEADTEYYLECDIKSLSGAGAKAGLVIEDENWSNDIEILVDAPDSGEWGRVYISLDTSDPCNAAFVGGGFVVGARSESNVELNPTGSSLVAVTNFYFGEGAYANPGNNASNVYPPDGAEYIPLNAVLEWARPLNYDPNAYDVYFTTDPNCNKPGHLVLDGKNQTTYDDPCDLEFNTEYFWRVNAYDANCTESCEWPYVGSVWSFTTMPEEPVFTTDAEHTIVAEGDSAVFSVISPNADPCDFQWYKGAATPVNDGDDGGDISVVTDATSSTLTISNVESADEDFYYCVATNSYDSTESTHAKLETPELLAHWTMDSPLLANQYKDETGNHHADPNKYQEVSFTTGIIGGALGAVEMNNFRWANAGSWTPNEYSGQMTVSAWIKVPDTNDIDGDGQGIVSKRVGDSFDWALYVRGGDGSHPDDSYVRFGSWNGGDTWSSLDALSEQWVYVTATVDGAGAGRLYVNGVVQAVDDEWVFGTNVDADILIGKGNPDQYVFPGLIDDVKIYNYARDNFQIAADYTDVAGGSVCAYENPVDYNGDCNIDLADVVELALIWRNCNIIPPSACP